MRWIAIAALLVGACGSSDEPDAAQVQREVDAKLAELTCLSCKRPVLRGTPIDGPAASDIVALTAQNASPLAKCIDRWTPLYEKIGARTLPVDQRDDVERVVSDCGEIAAAAISRAIGHVEACTPRPQGADPMAETARPFALVTLADRAARALVTSGRAADGLRRMLDVIALANDWSRGGGGLMAAEISAALINKPIPDAQAAVAKLAPDELAETADEIDRLEAGIPPVYDAMASDAVADATAVLDYDPDLAARGWRSMQTTQDALVHACPAEATDGACVAAMNALPDIPTRMYALDVRNIARAHARIYELALEVAVRRLGHCPTEEDWASPALAARLAPPALGITMTATAEAGGVWRIDIPAAFEREQKAPVTLARITCARP